MGNMFSNQFVCCSGAEDSCSACVGSKWQGRLLWILWFQWRRGSTRDRSLTRLRFRACRCRVTWMPLNHFFCDRFQCFLLFPSWECGFTTDLFFSFFESCLSNCVAEVVFRVQVWPTCLLVWIVFCIRFMKISNHQNIFWATTIGSCRSACSDRCDGQPCRLCQLRTHSCEHISLNLKSNHLRIGS